jgi:hypothetical protein
LIGNSVNKKDRFLGKAIQLPWLKTTLSGTGFRSLSLTVVRVWLLNQIFKSLQAETADIDLALAVDDLLRQRFPDRRRVFEAMA